MGGSRAPRLCHAAVDHAPWLIPYAVAEAPEAEAGSWNNNKDSVPSPPPPPPPPPPPASAPLHPSANRSPLLIENFGMFDREEAACTTNSTRAHTLRLADAAIPKEYCAGAAGHESWASVFSARRRNRKQVLRIVELEQAPYNDTAICMQSSRSPSKDAIAHAHQAVQPTSAAANRLFPSPPPPHRRLRR